MVGAIGGRGIVSPSGVLKRAHHVSRRPALWQPNLTGRLRRAPPALHLTVCRKSHHRDDQFDGPTVPVVFSRADRTHPPTSFPFRALK